MKIGQRLGLGFSLILLMLTFITIIAMFASLHPRHQLTETISSTNIKFSSISAMRQSLLRQGIYARRIGLSVEFDDMKSNMAQIIGEKNKYDTLEAQLFEKNISEDEREIIKEIAPYKKNVALFQTQAEELVANFNGGQAAKILSTQAAPIQEKWLEAIDRLVEIQNEHIRKNLHEFNIASNKANQAILIIGTITVILAGAIALYLTRSITSPLNQALSLSKRVAEGDLDVQIPPSSLDETGELLSSLNEMTLRLKEARDALYHLATQDGLTAVANRRSFDKTIGLEWKRLVRQAHTLNMLQDTATPVDANTLQLPLSLLMIDVDFFKQYNDRYGHQAGDDCLRKVAGAIVSVTKRPNDLVARYGGEEFAVILPNVPLEGARTVAENIRAAVEQLELPSGNPTVNFVTVSIGAATTAPLPDLEEQPSKLIAIADAALYEAKRTGRNRVILKSYTNDPIEICH